VLQPEQLEAGADQAVEARGLHAEVGEKVGALLVRQLGDLALDLGADGDDLIAAGRRHIEQGLEVGVLLGP
jgi:hypothetical protein